MKFNFLANKKMENAYKPSCHSETTCLTQWHVGICVAAQDIFNYIGLRKSDFRKILNEI